MPGRHLSSIRPTSRAGSGSFRCRTRSTASASWPSRPICLAVAETIPATLMEEIAQCPGIDRRVQGSERVSGAYVTSDFTYSAKSVAGDGWVLIGDAFGFLDPIYSSGVFIALKSGELAADCIHQALTEGDCGGKRLGVRAEALRRAAIKSPVDLRVLHAVVQLWAIQPRIPPVP